MRDPRAPVPIDRLDMVGSASLDSSRNIIFSSLTHPLNHVRQHSTRLDVQLEQLTHGCVAAPGGEALESLRHQARKKAGPRVITRRELLRNGTLIASGTVCAPWMTAMPDWNQATADKTWTIGNDLVKRTLSFQPKLGLVTQQFSDLSTGVDLVTSG